MYNPQLVAPTLPSGPWEGTSFIHMELQSPGDELQVTFARAGSYRYSCLLHEEMDGYVEVVAPGAPGITTQATVDQFAATHFQEEHAEDAAKLLASRSVPTRIDGPLGGSLWFVRAGTNERRGHLDLNAFLPDRLTVAPGDTVIWYVDHQIPHTVTFPPANGSAPDFIALQLPDGTVLPPSSPGQQPSPDRVEAMRDPARAPRLVFVGGVATRPSPSYDGVSFSNSGFIGEHPLVSYPMEKTWALTFDTPGVYQYLCLLHEQQGMKATITVQPR
jgi:plastocyanin